MPFGGGGEMQKTAWLAALLLVLSAVSAPAGTLTEADVKRTGEASKRILAEALRTGRTHALLKDLCKTAPRRLSGSEGMAKAEAWAERALKDIGLENVRLEACKVPHWERGSVAELACLAPVPDTKLPILAIGGSVATPGDGLTAEVVEVKSFDELHAKADRVKGRIVFFNRPMDATLPDTFAAYGGAADQRVRGALEAAKVGAVAVVVRSLTTLLDDIPHTGTLFYAAAVKRIPAVAVSTLGAERLAALLAGGKTVKLRMRLDCRWHEDAPAHNVVGELRGTSRPDEILVVGGHLDSWDVGEGAHDDGAGCCQSIAALALLKTLNLRPKRTIRVVLFANEENGSRGGRGYVRTHAAELKHHVLALESDRGGFTPRGFATNAGPAALEILRALAAPLRSAGIEYVRPGGGGADISHMAKFGVVLVGYVPDSQRYFDLHHSARDTIETVNERELELGTAVIASLLYGVADMEKTLPRNDAQAR
jgi:carboxypeptidase Q